MKLVVMSATLEAEKFQGYFLDAPLMKVGGGRRRRSCLPACCLPLHVSSVGHAGGGAIDCMLAGQRLFSHMGCDMTVHEEAQPMVLPDTLPAPRPRCPAACTPWRSSTPRSQRGTIWRLPSGQSYRSTSASRQVGLLRQQGPAAAAVELHLHC